MNYDRPELASKLAAEYQLGLMQGRARQRFERLIRSSPAIARAVSSWGDALAPLAEATPITTRPRPAVWEAIEKRTIARPAPHAASATKSSWWSGFNVWRAGGLVAAGVIAGIAVTQLWPLLNPTPAEQRIATGLPGSYVGFLADATGQPAVLVGQLRQARELGIKVVKPQTVPPNSRLHLWAIGPDGTPIPLGFIPAQGKGQLTTTQPAEQLFSKIAELAVSVETEAAPAKPTGAFILRGPCVKLW